MTGCPLPLFLAQVPCPGGALLEGPVPGDTSIPFKGGVLRLDGFNWPCFRVPVVASGSVHRKTLSILRRFGVPIDARDR